MRILARLVLPGLLAACTTAPGGFSPSATCQSDYDRCVRQEPDAQTCEAYREACVERADAVREKATEKQRGYDAFKREREEAGE